jgi:hypothetical protein
MPKEQADKTELVEAARVMASPPAKFVQFMTDAMDAAEQFAADAEARKGQNEQA